MIIYLLTFPNGKQYVGQTVRMLGVRISHHRQAASSGSRLPVHCAWRKYGEPSVSVLGKFSDMHDLHAAERSFIVEYGTLSPGGYNVTAGGDTAPSKCPEVARKISAKAQGRLHSKETREKLAKVSKSKWQDDEYRAKVMAGIAESFTPERRAQMSENARITRSGKKATEETKAKLKARIITDEWRAKMSAAAKDRVRGPVSAETRAKMSENAKRAWRDKEITERRLIALRNATSSDDFSEKMKVVANTTWADPEIRQRRISSKKGIK